MTLPATPSVGAVIGAKYDCGFIDDEGNFVGLCLVRSKEGIPTYNEKNDPAISRQYFTGQVGYANFENQKEIQEGQNDWSGGFGQEFQDGTKINSYLKSSGLDCRFKGRVLPAPMIQSLEAPYYLPQFLDLGFELWSGEDDLTYWTETVETNGEVAQESTNKTEGSYSAKLRFSITGTTDVFVEQDATLFSLTTMSGIPVYISANMKSIHASAYSNQKVGLDDGVATNYVAMSQADWERVTVGLTINVAATKLAISLWSKNNGTYSPSGFYVDDIQAPNGNGEVNSFCEFDDDLYFNRGGWLCKIDHVTFAQTVVAGFPKITDLEVFVDDRMYIACGEENLYYYMDTDGNITQTNSKAELFKRVGNSMYKAMLPNEIYVATDPSTDAGWGTVETVGSTMEDITDLEEIEGIPYIMKENFPYYIDTTGDVYALIPGLVSEKASTSGKNTVNWQGKLYIPCGDQALYEYDEGVVTDISPSKYIVASDEYDGRITALASDAQWLFAFIESDDDCYVLAGRWQTINGTNEWVWHTFLEDLDMGAITVAKSSTVYRRKMWYGNADGDIHYFALTSRYGNIEDDPEYDFGLDGTLTTSWLYYNLLGDQKCHYKITVRTGNTTVNKHWMAYYQKWGDTDWTAIGGVSTPEPATLYLPRDSDGNRPASEMIRYMFQYSNSVGGLPALLYSYDVRGIWYPNQKRMIDISVRVPIYGNLALNDGSIDTIIASDLRAKIWDWINPEVSYPRAFYPIYFNSDSDILYCKVIPSDDATPVGMVIHNCEPGGLEWAFNLKLLVTDGITEY